VRRRRILRTKNNTATSEMCVSNRDTRTTTTVCPSSSSSQIVDVQSHCSLERQTTRYRTKFFVEDILRADFGVRHPSNYVRLDATLRSLSNDQQRSTLALTTCNCNSPVQTSNAASVTVTQRDEATRCKTPDLMLKSLNVDMLPAWIFCTRYSDRPSSGKDTSTTFLSFPFLQRSDVS